MRCAGVPPSAEPVSHLQSHARVVLNIPDVSGFHARARRCAGPAAQLPQTLDVSGLQVTSTQSFPSSRAPRLVGVTKTQGWYFGYISISAATVTRYSEPYRATTPRNPKKGASANDWKSEKGSSTSRHSSCQHSSVSRGHQYSLRYCGLQSSPCPRQHLPQNNPNRLRPMFPRRPFQRIRPLKSIGPHNLHLPSIIRLGAHNRNPPITTPIGQDMFDDGSNICLQTRIPRVLHLH